MTGVQISTWTSLNWWLFNNLCHTITRLLWSIAIRVFRHYYILLMDSFYANFCREMGHLCGFSRRLFLIFGKHISLFFFVYSYLKVLLGLPQLMTHSVSVCVCGLWYSNALLSMHCECCVICCTLGAVLNDARTKFVCWKLCVVRAISWCFWMFFCVCFILSSLFEHRNCFII